MERLLTFMRMTAGYVKQATPYDFSRDALYIVARSDAQRYQDVESIDPQSYYYACCGLEIDQQLRPYLEATGQWQDRGCSVLVHDECLAPVVADYSTQRLFNLLAGITVHEVAHWLDQKANVSWAANDPLAGRQAKQAEKDGDFESTLYYRADQAHGAQWLRAVFHLQHRMKLVGVDIPDADLNADHYSMSTIKNYRMLLSDELGRLKTPIHQVLQIDPPKLFRQLFLEDAGAKVVSKMLRENVG